MEKNAKHRQQEREKHAIYKADESSNKPKFYALDMFPYPSGAGLHVGHPKGYVATDVLARTKMLQGYNVLHPMGRDAFGLPAEQYAIKNKVNPTVSTAENVAWFKQQLQNMWFTYDWDREVNTTDPEFYKWTQWTFIKLYEHYYDRTAKKAKPISELPIPTWLSDDEKKQYVNNHRLAYVDYKPILRSVDLQTAIAQEDLDENGNCERTGWPVERRPMRQRVIRITDYADRLLEWLDELVERPDSVKQMQRHWIGKAEWTEFTMQIQGYDDTIGIYTTRIDTVYGMSYVALAPEHPLLSKITTAEQSKAVEKYIKQTKNKGELQRTDLNKDKTGVFTGAYAINPFNQQPVPIRVADYVLGGYGTGAVMAVPAHDERDFAFAKKYDLPIVQSIAPEIIGEWEKTPQKNKETIKRNVVDVIIENKKGEFLVLERDGKSVFFVGWWIDDNEDELQAIKRELIEETGYTDFQIQWPIVHSYTGYWGYRNKKQVNHRVTGQFFYAKLTTDKQQKSEVDEWKHTIQWVKKEDVVKLLTHKPHQIARNVFLNWPQVTTEKWVLIESWDYSGMTSDEAITAMQIWLQSQWIGGKKTQYKLQDRVFSRQRYRGEPIPMIHTADGIKAINQKELPLRLPEVEHYEPTGTEEGPLANITDWVNTPEGKRETNTMPQRAGSSRYRLRYMDPKNPNNLVDPAKEKYRWQVDVYVGGMEHATRHLIYARFWHKFLYDIGVVSTSEPFKKLYGVGLVLAEDGRKMSKRRWNVVNPDDVIAQYGADAFRTYEMFMWPFENEVARSTAWVKWVKKFLDKVEKISQKISSETGIKNQWLLHKTIKKVSEDIENFRFNTAISQLMILVNALSDEASIDHKTMEILTLLISPFAPHLAETLREKLGNEFSVFTKGKRPSYDEKLLVDNTVKIAVQFNGKVRGTIQITPTSTQDEVMQIIQNDAALAARIESTPKKIIYIPGKIINIIL
jgi:leucyl-tRNA synthetase